MYWNIFLNLFFLHLSQEHRNDFFCSNFFSLNEKWKFPMLKGLILFLLLNVIRGQWVLTKEEQTFQLSWIRLGVSLTNCRIESIPMLLPKIIPEQIKIRNEFTFSVVYSFNQLFDYSKCVRFCWFISVQRNVSIFVNNPAWL